MTVSSCRILLIEDSVPDADLLEYELRSGTQRPFDVVRATTLTGGLRHAGAERFDVVLLDLDLPDSARLETVRRACQSLSNLPVIVLTGLDDEEVAQESLRCGAQDYLVKGESDPWAMWRAIDYSIERKHAQESISATSRALGLQAEQLTGDLATGAKHLQQEVRKRLHSEQLLRESEQLARKALAELTALYETAPVGLALMDTDFRFVRINDRLAAINGRPAAEHIGRTIREIVPDLADAIEPIHRRVLESAQPVLDVELHGVTRAEPETQKTWLCSCHPIRSDSPQITGISVVVQDITLRKEMERRLRATCESLEQRTVALHEASAQLTRAEQRERDRIARILHDELQQLLFAAKLEAGSLRAGLATPSAEAAVRHLEDLLGRSLRVARSLVADLVPAALEQGGLPGGLKWLAEQMEGTQGLKVRLDVDPAIGLAAKGVQVALYQCIRELLFNVVKHAKAPKAGVCARWDGPAIRVEVRDEGVGFDPAAAEANSCFGLRDIRQRLLLLGGRLDIASTPGRGSHFAIHVPVAAPDAPQGRSGPENKAVDRSARR